MSLRMPGEIDVIASPYCPPGRVFLVSTPIKYELGPLRLLEPDPMKFELPASFRYGIEMRIPKPPTFVMATNIIERRTCRQMWRDMTAMSERWRARRQRRLDYRSNVRRRKRWSELKQRKESP